MSDSGTSELTPKTLGSRLSFFGAGNRIYVQLGVLFVVGLLLTLALQQIDTVVTERSDRHDSTVREISNAWGAEQLLAGPILMVPYRYFERLSNTYEVECSDITLSEFHSPKICTRHPVWLL